ncbi:diaminopropionate ammonia-lyase [Nonomuraea sp. LPB2021202275-12-8]|uniref:diaminopropionate ammonia-lyase n=1 Tax=Nonomuraea sp. LPB2021202275-12-8 TaxID=3120159 RepID=UPI00300CC50F
MPTAPREYFVNANRSAISQHDRALLGMPAAQDVSAERAALGDAPPTSLLGLSRLKDLVAVGEVRLKDESDRFGLGSFKALGGSYAVVMMLRTLISADLCRPVTVDDLIRDPVVRSAAASKTITCASAGNHGLSVVAGAKKFGAQSVVWLSNDVPDTFAVRLERLGAVVRRAGSDYRESEEAARSAARVHGWHLLADSSWAGYTRWPLEVMRGYTTLAVEAAAQWERSNVSRPSHVFVQAGVGGLAASVAAYLRDRWGEDFCFVVVEPVRAACLLASAKVGEPTRVEGGLTDLGRLDCPDPSLLAFEQLGHLADVFMTITDDDAAAAATFLKPEISLSACGAAGAAGLMVSASDPELAHATALDSSSRVLLIGTERAL